MQFMQEYTLKERIKKSPKEPWDDQKKSKKSRKPDYDLQRKRKRQEE